MKKFGCGIAAAFLLLAIVALVWLSLDEQSKGIVVGLLLGAVGTVIGVILALAVVCVFLLLNMRWQIQGGKPTPPIVMGWPGYGHPGLPPPANMVDGQWHYPPSQPAWHRQGRGWHVLGGEDMPPEWPPPEQS